MIGPRADVLHTWASYTSIHPIISFPKYLINDIELMVKLLKLMFVYPTHDSYMKYNRSLHCLDKI